MAPDARKPTSLLESPRIRGLFGSTEVPVNWKTNLGVIWFSQVMSLTGFMIGLPLTSLYIQKLGITDPAEYNFWAGLLESSAALAFAMSAPIWGMLADRYGRKLMLIRACVGAMVCLFGIGLAPNAYWVLFFRFFQGVFTGTVPAAQTLVSVHTPDRRQGFALAIITTAPQTGIFLGRFLGGWFADAYGFRNAFFLGGAMLSLTTIFVMFFVRENFTPPDRSARRPLRERFGAFAVEARRAKPALLAFVFMNMAFSVTMAFLPLLVQEIRGGLLEGSATKAGQIAAVAGLASVITGTTVGFLLDRIRGGWLALVVCTAAAGFAWLTASTEIVWHLFLIRFGFSLFASSLFPLLHMWLSRLTSKENRGSFFGWAVTARNLGLAVANLGGGVLAYHHGVRSVFYAQAVLLFVLGPIYLAVGRRIPRSGDAESGEEA